jgi:hypothetical protein
MLEREVNVMLGPWLITAGYLAAILGGAILFINTPPDVGGTHALMIPRGRAEDVFREPSHIQSRAFRNRIGFALLTLGGLLQIGGYWCDRLAL